MLPVMPGLPEPLVMPHKATYAAQGDIWGNAISSAGSFAQDMWGDKLSGWWKNRGSGDGEIGGGSGGVPFRGRA
jgi:hypothetical protein